MSRGTEQFKATVRGSFAAALHRLDDLGREPNWKEEECLFRALGYMKRGNYKLADAKLKELSVVFSSAQKYAVPSVSTREPYTIKKLKRSLAQLRAE